jgi:hypothetical protein
MTKFLKERNIHVDKYLRYAHYEFLKKLITLDLFPSRHTLVLGKTSF